MIETHAQDRCGHRIGSCDRGRVALQPGSNRTAGLQRRSPGSGAGAGTAARSTVLRAGPLAPPSPGRRSWIVATRTALGRPQGSALPGGEPSAEGVFRAKAWRWAQQRAHVAAALRERQHLGAAGREPARAAMAAPA